MGSLLSVIALFFFGCGLWQHDWRIIFVSVLLACIWPLIRDEVLFVEERRHRELLDRLWDDDDDLPGSA